ncbi:unnamed protein product, partial [Pelagomonas calceolata]
VIGLPIFLLRLLALLLLSDGCSTILPLLLRRRRGSLARRERLVDASSFRGLSRLVGGVDVGEPRRRLFPLLRLLRRRRRRRLVLVLGRRRRRFIRRGRRRRLRLRLLLLFLFEFLVAVVRKVRVPGRPVARPHKKRVQCSFVLGHAVGRRPPRPVAGLGVEAEASHFTLRRQCFQRLVQLLELAVLHRVRLCECAVMQCVAVVGPPAMRQR